VAWLERSNGIIRMGFLLKILNKILIIRLFIWPPGMLIMLSLEGDKKLLITGVLNKVK